MSMYLVLFRAHSDWRWIVILIGAALLIKYLAGLLSNSRWSRIDHWLGLGFTAAIDIQFLLGLVLWVMGRHWTGIDPLRSWEHPVTMILAIAAAHITWTRVKRASESSAKYQTGLIGFLIAGLLILLGILRITRVLG
jgi:hypothetical protein